MKGGWQSIGEFSLYRIIIIARWLKLPSMWLLGWYVRLASEFDCYLQLAECCIYCTLYDAVHLDWVMTLCVHVSLLAKVRAYRPFVYE